MNPAVGGGHVLLGARRDLQQRGDALVLRERAHESGDELAQSGCDLVEQHDGRVGLAVTTRRRTGDGTPALRHPGPRGAAQSLGNVERDIGHGELQRPEEPLREQMVHPGPASLSRAERVGRGGGRRQPAEERHGRGRDAACHHGQCAEHDLHQRVGDAVGWLGHGGLRVRRTDRPRGRHRRAHRLGGPSHR